MPSITAHNKDFAVSPHWIRLTASLDAGSDPRRVWADLFSWSTDTMVLVRDYPENPAILDCLPSQGSNLAVLPARGADYRIRSTIEHLRPAAIVFYGSNAWVCQPGLWIERWRARFPNIEFWSTMLHGGITIRSDGDGVTIYPTIAETGWRDPDL